MKGIVLSVLVSVWIGALWYASILGLDRIRLLEALEREGSRVEGVLFPLPVAHGSGPKPASDWGYRYEIGGVRYQGYIRSRGPFRVPLGVNSLRELVKPPVAGDTVPVTFSATDPSRSVPFEIRSEHISYARAVFWVVLVAMSVAGIVVLLVMNVILSPKKKVPATG